MPIGKPIQPENGRIILAHGEPTGHHHSVPVADVVESVIQGSGEMFLSFCRDSVLSHQEHGEIGIPKGTYRAVRQQEYTPDAYRNVAD
jgi:hypothetical protein